ncbi:uncharacterized protein [Rutidosis leptorrhynchoides]|uniref:uncharacterized protein n=1 Tax=Rutidosis leptorrhynchoides TaxID=125765 RepID=UPI003A99A8AE
MSNPKVKSGSGRASPTIPELIYELRSSFFGSDFQNLATKFTEHEELLKKKYNDLKKKSEEEKRLLISEKSKLINDLKKKKTEIEALQKQNDEYVEKVRVYEKLMMDLEKRVQVLQDIADKCEANQLQKTTPAESIRPVLSSEKGDPTKITETKSKEIIEIESDDDDDDDVVDDDQLVGTLKRRRVSNEVKKEHNSDLKSTSTVNPNRASKVIKLESKSNDYVDNTPTEVNKPENLDESNSQPVTYIDKVDEVYKSVAAKLKKQKEWKSEDDMKLDFEEDDDLCLAAVCALLRQKKIVHWSDNERCSRMAGLLLKGNLQNEPLKKADELDGSDLDDCRLLAKKYSYQIWQICEDKKDPFFPPKS